MTDNGAFEVEIGQFEGDRSGRYRQDTACRLKLLGRGGEAVGIGVGVGDEGRLLASPAFAGGRHQFDQGMYSDWIGTPFWSYRVPPAAA